LSHSIAIVGAGWYGCHVAGTLSSLGFSVTLFERNKRILHEASGNNQFRLHMGFHYARHSGTRIQSRDGYMRFMERYPALSGAVPNNIYAVPHRESLMDFATYKLVMTATGLDFREIQEAIIPLKGVSGMMLTPERVLYIERARVYFTKRLGSSLVLDHTVTNVENVADGVVVDGQKFDFLVDTTWGHLNRPPIDIFYEPTLLLYYEGAPGQPALTLVDGPLCSVYPTEDPNIYTLSSVPHTPLGIFATGAEARAFCSTEVTQDLISAKRKLMEAHIQQYAPDFLERFRFVGPQISIKTKLIGSHDDRSCYIYQNGPRFSVMSGKIDTIFVATEKIIAALDASFSGDLFAVPSTLKYNMATTR
jgi:hypothetical protein